MFSFHNDQDRNTILSKCSLIDEKDALNEKDDLYKKNILNGKDDFL